MHRTLNRRDLLVSAISGTTLLVAGPALGADTPIELQWSDLVPKSMGQQPQSPSGIIPHGQFKSRMPDPSTVKLTYEYNGKTVRIPGYTVPLSFDGTGTREFLLVPYVGACIHVPPPPANQLVLVTADEPYHFKGLFEPVFVTGAFTTGTSTTELADVGYSISSAKIEPYR